MSYSMQSTLAYDNKGFTPGNDKFMSYSGGTVGHRDAKVRGPVSRILVPLSVMCIELFERMTYFTITAGILFFTVQNLNYNINNGGLMALAIFSGGAYMTAPIGGILGDAILGRFNTILASTVLYIAGLAVLVTGSYDTREANMEPFDLVHRNNMTLAALIMIVLGTGGIKANVAPFGADQIRSLGESAVTSYFNWYYFVINIGSVVAVMGVSHLQSYEFLGKGLLIPLCGMAASLLLFAVMYSVYEKYTPEKINACKIIGTGCTKCEEGVCCAGAMESNGGSQPDSVVIGFSSASKAALLANFFIFIWTGVAMLGLASPLQSERMDRIIGKYEVPEYLYRAFPFIAVLCAVPILALVVLPCLRNNGKFRFTLLRRIGLGLLLVSMGVLTTGVVEKSRLDNLNPADFTNYTPSAVIMNYSQTNPVALEIAINVTKLEIENLINASQSQSSTKPLVPGNQTKPVDSKPKSGNEPPVPVDSKPKSGNEPVVLKDNERLSLALSNTSDELQKLFNDTWPTLQQFILTLKPTTQKLTLSSLPDLVPYLNDMPLETVETIFDTLPNLLTFLNALPPEYLKPIFATLPELIQPLDNLPPGNVTFILRPMSSMISLISNSSVDIQQAMIGVFPEMLPLLVTIQPDQLQMLLGFIPGVLVEMEHLPQAAVKPFVSVLPQLLPQMFAMGGDEVMQMQAMLPDVLDLLKTVPPGMLPSLIDSIPTVLPLFMNMTAGELQPLMEMLPGLLQMLNQSVPLQQLEPLLEKLPELLPLILPQLPLLLNMTATIPPQMMQAFQGSLPELIPGLANISTAQLGFMLQRLPHMLPSLLSQLESLPPALINAMLPKLPLILPQILTMSPDKINATLGMFPQISELMKSIPPEMQQPLADAMSSMLPIFLSLSPEELQPMMQMLPGVLPLVMKSVPPEKLQGLLKMLPQLLPPMLPLLPQMVGMMNTLPPEMLQGLQQSLPSLLSLLANMPVQTLGPLIKQLPKMLPQMMSQMGNIPPQMMKALLPYMPKLLPILLTQGLGVMEQVTGAAMLKAFPRIVAHLVKNTPDGFPLWELSLPINISSLSVLAQTPQFLMVGIGEVLAAVAGLELAYHQAPFSMQGLTTGIYVMVMGLGFFNSGLLLNFIDGLTEQCNELGLCAGTWFSPAGGDINNQHMYYMMFLLSGVMFVGFLLYLAVTSRCYRLVDPITFAEPEDSDLPGIELKGAVSGEIGGRINGYQH